MNAITLTASGVYRIGQVGATPTGPGGWYLTFVGSGWTGSVVLAQDRNAPGSVSQPITSASLTNVGYYDPTNGAAVAAGTAITSDASWQVDNVNYDLYLVYTKTAGSVTITIQPGSQLVTEPIEGPITAAGNVTRGTFGGNIPDTGDYAFPAALTVAGTSLSLSTAGVASAISGTTKVGTNQASGALTVNGHVGTGTGAVGGIVFKIPVTTGSGATAQTLTTVLTLSATTTVASTFAGPLAITGALTGVTTAAISSTATVTSASAVALAVGLAGATNPAFVVDSSTGSQAAGLKVTGATAAGTVAVAVISSGADANLTVNAKGTGTIGIGSVSTGAVTITPATTITGAATFSSSAKSTSPTGGIGYATGAGGAQVQGAGSGKATTVVSNTITTAITMNNAELAAATIVSFTFTNSTIAATDQVVVTHESAGTSGAYTFNAFPGGGSAVISVRNATAGALSEAIVLRVSVYKAVSA